MLEQKSFPCCHSRQCSPHTYLTNVTMCWFAWGTMVVSVYSWVYGCKNGHLPYNCLFTISIYLMQQQSLFTLQMVSGLKDSAYMMWAASTLFTSTKMMEAANFSPKLLHGGRIQDQQWHISWPTETFRTESFPSSDKWGLCLEQPHNLKSMSCMKLWGICCSVGIILK